MSGINIEILRKVRDMIAKEPLLFDMRYFSKTLHGRQEPLGDCPKGSPEVIRRSTVRKRQLNDTASCICGYAVKIAEPELFTQLPGRLDLNWIEEGARILNIPTQQASKLFITALWPNPWSEQWLDAKDYREEASLAISLLDFIINGNGDVLCNDFDIMTLFTTTA